MDFSTVILALLALPTIIVLLFIILIKIWPKADDRLMIKKLEEEFRQMN